MQTQKATKTEMTLALTKHSPNLAIHLDGIGAVPLDNTKKAKAEYLEQVKASDAGTMFEICMETEEFLGIQSIVQLVIVSTEIDKTIGEAS